MATYEQYSKVHERTVGLPVARSGVPSIISTSRYRPRDDSGHRVGDTTYVAGLYRLLMRDCGLRLVYEGLCTGTSEEEAYNRKERSKAPKSRLAAM